MKTDDGRRNAARRSAPSRRTTRRWWLTAVVAVVTVALALPYATHTASASATFLVNSSGDASDAFPGNGVCDDGAGNCTLRAAIEESNALAGADTINFGISTGTVSIAPLSALPTITDKATINATTQPGWTFGPIVEIRGDSAGAGVDGLKISAGNTTIRGLVINRFSGYGIWILSSGSNQISRCHIGTDFSATVDYGNGKSGVYIDNTSSNTIGGTSPSDADSNLISGNDENGVLISGASAIGNTVVDNAIGTTGSTSAALANTLDGVRVDSSASANTITTNVISANGLRGIYLTGGSSGTTVRNSGIGLNRFGNVDVGNGAEGVLIDGSNGNFIGLGMGAGNLISGNGSSGVVAVNGASSNWISGNGIGTNGSGTAAIPNDLNGVTLFDGTGNTVGGVNAGEGNLISGNGGFAGIEFQDPNATGNDVQGNLIGTNAAGTGAIPNTNDGVMLRSGAHGNNIGPSNVISGNSGWGVDVFDAASSANNVVANKIGTNAAGTSALPNLGGVRVRSDGDEIGAGSPGAGNVISGNTTENLRIGDATHPVTGVDVFRNYIGTDVFGATALGGQGVIIERSQAFLGSLDGYVPGNNVIAGNANSGIRIIGTGANGNVIKGNRIGISAFGGALGNNGYGVFIGGGTGNDLGDTAYVVPGNNIIAFNTLDGVRVDGSGTTGELIVGNSIYANGGLGIETINSGNGELAPPTIISVGANVDGTSCASCIVSVYSDAAGQGRVFEGSTTATGGGTWSLIGYSVAGPHLTATATDFTLGTSEFSPPFAVNLNREAGTPGSAGFSGDGGPATNAQLDGPHGVYFTPSTLYIADTGNNRIRTVSPNNPTGTINTVAGCCALAGSGGDGGLATSAHLSSPTDVFVDGSGNIYIADTNNCRIRRVTIGNGNINTIAGNGTCGFSGDGASATSAMINHPHGVAVEASGDILIADTDNHRIRRVSIGSGNISTIAGTGNAAYFGEGVAATSAMLNGPRDVYPSPYGGYVIADTQNHRVRRVDISGVISTIAGTGTAGYNGDNKPGVLAQLNAPEAIAVSPIGDVFIADTGNNRIRDALFGSGLIATVVGTGQMGTSPDAVNPLLATLNAPAGIADDELAVSDTGNQTVRSIAANVDPTVEDQTATSRPSTFCREGLGKPVGALGDWSVIIVVVGAIATRRRIRLLFSFLRRAIGPAYSPA